MQPWIKTQIVLVYLVDGVSTALARTNALLRLTGLDRRREIRAVDSGAVLDFRSPQNRKGSW